MQVLCGTIVQLSPETLTKVYLNIIFLKTQISCYLIASPNSKDTSLATKYSVLPYQPVHLVSVVSGPFSKEASHPSKCSIHCYQQGSFLFYYMQQLARTLFFLLNVLYSFNVLLNVVSSLLARTLPRAILVNVVSGPNSKDTFLPNKYSVRPYQQGRFPSQ